MIAFLCFVAAVTDGDTFRCASGERVRLAGIDAPELHGCRRGRQCTPGNGATSRYALQARALGKRAECRAVGASYGRVLAFCRVAGQDLGCAQVRAGYAVRRYSFGPQVCRR
jgi:micrococcal nuclease